jgi:hypothetical protein
MTKIAYSRTMTNAARKDIATRLASLEAKQEETERALRANGSRHTHEILGQLADLSQKCHAGIRENQRLLREILAKINEKPEASTENHSKNPQSPATPLR